MSFYTQGAQTSPLVNITKPLSTCNATSIAKGRYVYIRKNVGANDHLSLSEVEVWNLKGENIALKGRAGVQVSKSDQFDDGWHKSDNVNDGKENTSDGIFASKTTEGGWLQIDLGSVVDIGGLSLFGRADGGTSQNGNYTVFVSDSDIHGKSISELKNANKPGVSFYTQGAQANPLVNVTTLLPIFVSGMTQSDFKKLGRFEIQQLNAAALSERQIGYVDNDGQTVLSDLTMTQIGMLNRIQLAKWTDVQLNSLTAEQVSGLTQVQFNELSALQIRQLNTARLSATQLGYLDKVDKKVLSALTPTQVGAFQSLNQLTDEQLNSLSAEQVSEVTEAQFKTLSALQIRQINATGLTATQLGYVDKAGQTVLSDLTANQVGVLDATQLAELTNAQLSSLTPEQVSELTQTQFKALSASQITQFNIAGMSAKQLVYVDNVGKTVLSDLTAAQVDGLANNKLSMIEVSKLSVDDFTSMNDYQIQYLNTKSLTFDQLLYKNRTNTQVLRLLTVVQLSNLRASVVGSLTSVQLGSLSDEKIQALNAAGLVLSQLDCINSANHTVLSCLTKIQITILRESVVSGLTSKQIGSMTVAQVNCLNAAYLTYAQLSYVNSLNNTVLSRLTVGQLSNLNTTVVGNFTKTQISTFSDEQVQYLNAKGFIYAQLSYINNKAHKVLSLLTANQLTGLSEGVVAQLTSVDIESLSDMQIQLLNGSGLTSAQLIYKNNIGKDVLQLLTSAQIAALSNSVVGALTSIQIGLMSDEKIQALNGNALTSAQLKYAIGTGKMVLNLLTKKQCAALSARVVSELASPQFLAMLDEQVQALNVNELTSTQLDYQNSSGKKLLNLLTKDQCSALSASVVGVLSLTQIGLMADEQIQAINAKGLIYEQLFYSTSANKSVLSLLSADQFSVLSDVVISQLSIDQLSKLSILQTHSLTKIQMSVMSDLQIQALNANGLTYEHLAFCNINKNNVLNLLSPSQLSNLPITTVAQLNSVDIASMSDDHIRALNGNGLVYTQLEYIGRSGKKVLQLLTDPQCIALNNLVVGKLTSTQFGLLNDKKIQQLNAESFNWVQLSYLSSDNHIVLSLLNATQLYSLSGMVVSNLTLQQVSILSNIKITLLNGYGFNQLLLDYKSSENKSVLELMTKDQFEAYTEINHDPFSLNQIRKLSELQVQWFNESQVRRLTWWQIQVMRDEQIQALNCRGLTSDQLDYVNSSEKKVLTLLTKVQCAHLSSAIVAELTSAQINSMTEEQVQALDGSGLTTNQLAYTCSSGKTVSEVLVIDQYTALNSSVVGQLTSAKMAAMSDKQIQALNGKGLTSAQLDYENISRIKVLELLIKEQCSALISPLVSSLSLAQIRSMSDEKIQALSGSGLTSKQLEYTSSSGNKLLNLLTQKQCAYLSKAVIGQITSKQFGSMSDEQVQALSAIGVSASQLDYTNQSNKTFFQLLTNDQLSSLSVINELSAQKISGLTVKQLNCLTKLQVSKLTSLQINQMNDEQVQALNADGFTSKQLAWLNKNSKSVLSCLTDKGIACLHVDDLLDCSNFKYLRSDQIKALSLETISNLDANTLSIISDYFTDAQYLAIKAENLYITYNSSKYVKTFYDQNPKGYSTWVVDHRIYAILNERNTSKLSCDVISELSWYALTGYTLYSFDQWEPNLEVPGFVLRGRTYSKWDKLTPINYLTLKQLGAIKSTTWSEIKFQDIRDFTGEKFSITGNNGRSILSHYNETEIKSLSKSQVNALDLHVLFENDKNKISILNSVYDKLSPNQIACLEAAFFSKEVTVAGSKVMLINALSDTQLSGVTGNQVISFSDAVKASLVSNPKKLSIIRAASPKIKVPKYAVSKPIALYGAVMSDSFFRGLQFSNYLDTTKSWSAATQGSINNALNTSMVNQLSLQTQLDKFRTSRTGAIGNIWIDGGAVTQILQVLAGSIRWSERYGSLKENDARYANAANSVFASTSLIFKTVTSFYQATYDQKSDARKAASSYLIGTGNALKLFANISRVYRALDSNTTRSNYAIEDPGLFGGIYAVADVMAWVGNITAISSKPAPEGTTEIYSFVVQICSLVGGLIGGALALRHGWIVSKLNGIVTASAEGLGSAEAVSVGCELLQNEGVVVTDAMRASEDVQKLMDHVKTSVDAGNVWSRVSGGLLLLALAANPAPYLQAKQIRDSAEDLRRQSNEIKREGITLEANYLFADALDSYADIVQNFAITNTVLLALQAVCVFAGQTFVGNMFALVSGIVAMHQQVAFDLARMRIGTQINMLGGLQRIYDQNLGEQNKLSMDAIMTKYPNLLNDYGFSSLTLFGGQALTETAVALGIYATNSYAGENTLFAQPDLRTTQNFANTITSDDASKYTTKVNLFDRDFIIGNGQAYQWVDLTDFILKSEASSESKPCYSGLAFYNPLLLPNVCINTGIYETPDGKFTSLTKYLNDVFAGFEFNLAAIDLNRSQFVVFDLFNLLVNYVGNSEWEVNKTIFIRNKILLGNSQYYIYGSLANSDFLNANQNSGKGVAILDYSKLSETGYDASIHMKMSSNRIYIKKNLTSSSSSIYYQENNSGTTTITSGKRTVTAKYLQIQEIKGSSLTNQSDLVYADSCVNSVIMTNGFQNILTGYNGWTLQGGDGARYYFNRFSNNFIKSAEDYSVISIFQGKNIRIDADGFMDSDVISTSIVSIESLMDVRDVYFYIGDNLRDLEIVNTETQQKYVIYNFMINSSFNNIYLSEGINSYSINGEDLASYFRNSVMQANLFTGISVQANPDLWCAEVTYNQIGTNVVNGSLASGVSKAIDYKYNILDYRSMIGSISADFRLNQVFKYDNNGDYKSLDDSSNFDMIFGTNNSDSYLGINKSVAISDFKGNNLFSIEAGGDLQVSGLLDAPKESCTQEFQVYVDDLASMDFYLDISRNLHVTSKDSDNYFSITINQYGDREKGAGVKSNLLLSFYSRGDNASLGYLAANDINGLINKMASMHSPGISTDWIATDYSGFLKPWL